MRVSMILAVLIGLAYIVWLAWAEGWRLWVVLGVMSVVGLVGGAVHLAMGMARQREGLEGSHGVASSEGADDTDRIDGPPGGAQ